MSVEISCPACGEGKFYLKPELLLTGKTFGCSSCDAEISLCDDSKNDLAKGLQDFRNIEEKRHVLKKTASNPLLNS